MPIAFNVSKQGKDVLSISNPNDYIFNANLNTFKILSQGTFAGSVTAGTTTFTLAHGQGAVPAIYGFAKYPDGYVALPSEKPRNEGDPVQRYWNIEVDSGTIYFNFFKGTASNYGVNVAYYIFESPLS